MTHLFILAFFLIFSISAIPLAAQDCVVDELEDFAKNRYAQAEKSSEDYRKFDETTKESVRQFYQLNHRFQTLDFVLKKKQQYLNLDRYHMDIFEAMDLVDNLIDESDPDINLPQSCHFYQTAEAIRRDGYPRWLILTGFIHDLGKVLAASGDPQWSIVGDTFPVGCAFSNKIVFPEYFDENSDKESPLYQSAYGIYAPNCGFDNLHLSWGHDEYLYQVVKEYLPKEALYIIRFHSFYAAHREGAYGHLMSSYDEEMIPYLKLFSSYDLYSKNDEPLDIESLRPYYEDLVQEFFPGKLNW